MKAYVSKNFICWKNQKKIEKILKIVKKFPRWLVKWELTKKGIKAYVSRIFMCWKNQKKMEKILKIIRKFPQ